MLSSSSSSFPQGYGSVALKVESESETKSEKQSENQSQTKSANQRWLLALISVIALISVLGSFAHLNEKRSTFVSRAAIASHSQQGSKLSPAEFISSMASPTECETWANTPAASLADVSREALFETSLTPYFELSFKLIVHAVSSGFGSILFVGDGTNNEQRMPGVWLYKNNQKKVQFSFNAQDPKKAENVFVEIELGQEYDVRVVVSDLSVQVFFDDNLEGTLQLDANDRFYRRSVPVYAGNPWNNVADAVVKDLQVCNERMACSTWDNSQSALLKDVTREAVIETSITDHFIVGFKFTVNAVNSGFGSMIFIGDGLNNERRMPGVWLYKNEEKRVFFSFNAKSPKSAENVFVDISLKQEYDVQVVMVGLQVKVFFDGQLAGTLQLDANDRFYGDGIPVYAGNPWDPLADAVVKDVAVCHQTTTPAPTTSPTTGSCQRFPQSYRLEDGNLVTTMDVGQNYDASFTLNIAIGSTKGNIFMIGKESGLSAPRMYYIRDGGKMLYVKFDGGNTQTEDAFRADGTLTQGIDHEIKLEVRGYDFQVYVDGQVVMSETMRATSKLTGQDLPVYAPRADYDKPTGTIRNIVLCNL